MREGKVTVGSYSYSGQRQKTDVGAHRVRPHPTANFCSAGRWPASIVTAAHKKPPSTTWQLRESHSIVWPPRCREVVLRGLYDPNEKEVYPEHLAEPGQRLDYTIHFENYGNDTAFAVIVLDTLAAELDVTRFTFEGSSHPCKVTVEGTTAQPVLNFAFLPITLPAKKQDSVASKGYVKFSLGIKPAVARGTYVKNRASIYFDRNPAVVTEYATVQVRENERVTGLQNPMLSKPGLAVTPNPAQERFVVHLPKGRYGTTLYVRDLAGRLVHTEKIAQQQQEVEISGLEPGLYTLSVDGLRPSRVVVNP